MWKRILSLLFVAAIHRWSVSGRIRACLDAELLWQCSGGRGHCAHLHERRDQRLRRLSDRCVVRHQRLLRTVIGPRAAEAGTSSSIAGCGHRHQFRSVNPPQRPRMSCRGSR